VLKLEKTNLYCGSARAKLDPEVFESVVSELIALLDRQYGNIATVTARKFRSVKASRTEIGRALKLLRDMGILELSGDRRSLKNERSYIIHKSSRQNLVKILWEFKQM